MSEAVEDQLALILTDWERLLEVGVDLTTSHADCTAINALFGKRIVNLQPTRLSTSATAVSRNLQRLGKLRGRLVKIGIDTVTDSRLVAICEQLIHLLTATHPALLKFHVKQGFEISELLRLKELEQWAATRLAVHSSFPDAKCALGKLDKVTAYELRHLPPGTVDSDDLTFLKALELGARIRKGLSCAQHHLIDRIITTKIEALQKSKAITFSKTKESAKQFVVLQSKLEELEATIRTLKHDKKVMAEDKVALTRDKDNLALALKSIEDQNKGLQQALSHEHEAYNNLLSASQEDKKSLGMSIEKLKAEIAQWAKTSDSSGNMAKVLGELQCERTRLEDYVKCISDKLQYAEGAYTAMAGNADKLAAENAHMKAELAKSHEIFAQATISPSIHRARASGPDPTIEFLIAEKARLEKELSKANGTLGAIISSLDPYPVASPTSPSASGTADKSEPQTNRALSQAKEAVRNWDFVNAHGPGPEMKATNVTINTSKPNTNTLSQALCGDANNYTGTTNNWGPDPATLTPSTAVDNDGWSWAVPPSPSGSVESEL